MPGWLNITIILGLTTLGFYLFYDTALVPFEEPGEWDDLSTLWERHVWVSPFYFGRTNDE